MDAELNTGEFGRHSDANKLTLDNKRLEIISALNEKDSSLGDIYKGGILVFNSASIIVFTN